MKSKILFKTLFQINLLTVSVMLPAISAQASNTGILSKDRFQVRLRAIDVVPDESSSVNIGGKINAGNDIVPEIDLSYFFTDHISAEVIAATSKHKLKYNGSTPLGDVWALPPTVTLQYHLMPKEKFSPYLGAGINYTMMYNEKAAPGFTNLEIDNSFGPALQAGFDYWLNDRWGLNLDAKKIWMNIDAKVNNGTVRADVDLNPWVIGTGVSYRF